MPSQDVAVSLFYDGAWQGVDTEVFTAEKIKITRGDGDEGAALRPAKVTLTFDNRTDKYRPSNPESPLYGKAGRNTPLQVAVDDIEQTTVEATSWEPDQPLSTDRTKGRWSVDLEAYGLLGRISQWSDPLRSPFYRFNLATYGPDGTDTLVGYYPCEDPRDARKLFNAVPGGAGVFLRNVGFQSQQRFAGSDPLMDLNTDGFVTGTFATRGVDAGWQFSWTMRYAELPGAGLFSIVNVTTTTGVIYELSFEDGVNLFLTVGNTVIGTVVASGVGFGSADFTLWHMFRMKVTQSAGTVSVEVSWMQEDGDGFHGFTWTYAGTTTGELKLWGLTRDVEATFGHILGVTTGADDLEGPRVDAFHGHPGEPAGTRFLRLMDELGLNATLLGVEADTWPMGPQRGDTFLNLLQEMARTDDALIFDSRDEIGLTMRGRVDRYNQTPVLELTFGVDVAPPFKEILDDLDTHNRVTVSQRDGGDYEAILATGDMSVQPPPDGVGEYKQKVDVCTEDEDADLPVLAGWWLNRGTLARSRYASVTVNLGANPELADACNALDIGDLITVAGYEPDPVPLIVIGLVDTIGWHNKRITRSVTFTTRPADLFLPGVYGTARYDSGSTTTGSTSYAPSATSIVFSTTVRGDVWATTGNGTPYDCVCAGERFTVTAMGAVSGTGPYLQTATVRRGANGINKTLPANAEIHVATPGRYAL